MVAIKIGILGGTFDPIHQGHLQMAEQAQRALGLDRVIFIPAFVPPHKQDGRLISDFGHRLEMVRLAIQHYPNYSVSDMERQRSGRSYTYDTLKVLAAQWPEAELYFITGSDALSQLTTWYQWQGVLDLCYFVITTRPGYGFALDSPLLEASESSKKGIILLPIAPLDIASTTIRRRYQQGASWLHDVPEVVQDYIIQHQLYRSV